MIDGLPDADQQSFVVPVKRDDTAAVLNHNRVAVAADPTRFNDDAACRRVNRHTVIAADIKSAVETCAAENRMRAPTEFGRYRTAYRPNHSAAVTLHDVAAAVVTELDNINVARLSRLLSRRRTLRRKFRLPLTFSLATTFLLLFVNQPRNFLRRRHHLIVLAVVNILVVLHKVNQRLLLGNFFKLDVHCGFGFGGKFGLYAAVSLKLFADLLDVALMLQDVFDKLRIANHHAFEQIHTRQEVAEVFRAEQHVQIRNLPVDVNVAHAVFKYAVLLIELFGRGGKFGFVFADAVNRFVKGGLSLLVDGGSLRRVFVELPFEFRHRIDFPLNQFSRRPRTFSRLFVGRLLGL